MLLIEGSPILKVCKKQKITVQVMAGNNNCLNLWTMLLANPLRNVFA